MRLRFLLLGFALIALSPVPVSAATIQLSGTLDGALANAGAGTGSTGSGTVSVTLDDVTGDLSWSFAFAGLLGDFTVAHFHGPALPNQNAGVQIGTPVVLDASMDFPCERHVHTVIYSRELDVYALLAQTQSLSFLTRRRLL